MKKVLIVLLFVAASASVKAQGIVGFSLQGLAPIGELRQDSPDIFGGGFSMEAGYKLPTAPILVGVSMGAFRYGSELRKGDHGEFWGDVRWRRNFEAFRFLPFIRLQPSQSGKILPYGDFYTGFTYITTRTTIRERGLELLDTFTDVDDIVFSYGFGGGIEVMLADAVSLDFNVKYLKSGRAQYLTPADVSYDSVDNFYDLDVQNSRFNTLSFGIGVKVILNEW